MARQLTSRVDAPVIPRILLSSITKVFHTDEREKHALSDVSLEVRRGEYLAIVGPAGAGKTTLLFILGLLEPPTTGTYLLDGRAVETLTPLERAHIRNRRVGFVFQEPNLVDDHTVAENVALPLGYRRMTNEERRARAFIALSRVGMWQQAKQYPTQLSSDQQQRVTIARAIAGDPLLIVADEPAAQLDPATARATMAILREVNQQGSTICMATHDLQVAQYADRSVHLSYGRTIEVM